MSPERGPLAGLRVLELASIGPGPHAAMVLADLGADVVRIERPPGQLLEMGSAEAVDMGLRGRRSIALDLRTVEGRDELLELVSEADALIEGMRPGVAERLGVGPDECHPRNPGLVYGRVTGWGQTGPLAHSAGHDINYIGLTGLLHAMGPADRPPSPPLNMVGDYGGGSMLLLVGVLAALFERSRSGRGQVVDAAMVDGAALLSQMLLALRGMDGWSDRRQDNLLDGAAPFYNTYRCRDGRFVAVGALESQFFAALLTGLEVEEIQPDDQHDRATWPRMREVFEQTFALRPRDEWSSQFAGLDACVTPVLEFSETTDHPHLRERRTHLISDGVLQAAPAPRFSRTTIPAPHPPQQTGATSAAEVLDGWRTTVAGDVSNT